MFFMFIVAVLASTTAYAQVEKYGFSLAGIEVTSANYENLSGLAGIEGTVTYDPTVNKLTLNNATITTTGITNAILNSTCENLEIEVTGTNSLTSKEAAITNTAATTISGTGTLNAKSTSSAAIYLERAPFAIKECKLYAEGNWGICGDDVSEELYITHAYVEATGAAGSICDLGYLDLTECSITQPADAEFDVTQYGVAVDGTIVTDKVIIKPEAEFKEYGFSIAGIKVTSTNYENLSDIAGVEGTITYDPTAKKLTLDNATITASSAFAAIDNQECENLEIELIGTNNISAREIAFDNAVPTTISGTGTLKAKSERSAAFYIESTTLTVKDSKLYAEGLWGISGDQESETINVAGAYIEAIGKQGSICTIAALNLENCSIIQPTGAAFDAAVHGVAVDGALVTEKVVISTETNAIQGINTDMQTGKQGICTMQGMKMGKQWNELPAGIYIVDGVKCIKK